MQGLALLILSLSVAVVCYLVMTLGAWLWTLGLLAWLVWLRSLGLSCTLMSRSVSGNLYKQGDVIIGGLFPVHIEAPEPDHSFTQTVQAGHCQR